MLPFPETQALSLSLLFRDTEAKVHALVCFDTVEVLVSGLVLRLPFPLRPCVAFTACHGECRALIKYQEPSICLYLSSGSDCQTAKVKATCAPLIPRQEGGGLGGWSNTVCTGQDTKMLLFRRLLCTVGGSGVVHPQPPTPKATFLCCFFPIRFTGLSHSLRHEDSLWSQKRQVKGTVFPLLTSVSDGG